jgi:hypothetical protein
MFNASNRIVEKISFEVFGEFINGEVQLLGQASEKIPRGTKFIEVIKDKTKYKFRFRNG